MRYSDVIISSLFIHGQLFLHSRRSISISAPVCQRHSLVDLLSMHDSWYFILHALHSNGLTHIIVSVFMALFIIVPHKWPTFQCLIYSTVRRLWGLSNWRLYSFIHSFIHSFKYTSLTSAIQYILIALALNACIISHFTVTMYLLYLWIQ